VQYVGLSQQPGAGRSALFPLLGGVSVLVAGWLSDKLGLNGRNLVMVFGMAASTLPGALARTPDTRANGRGGAGALVGFCCWGLTRILPGR